MTLTDLLTSLGVMFGGAALLLGIPFLVCLRMDRRRAARRVEAAAVTRRRLAEWDQTYGRGVATGDFPPKGYPSK